MDKLVIRGGTPLLGTVRISGAKNAALPCMAAALTDETVILENVPQVRDIETTASCFPAWALKWLGYGRASITTIHAANLASPASTNSSNDCASTLVKGPLVARCGRAPAFPCRRLCDRRRPIDLHTRAGRRLGAKITQDHGYVEASADRLRGDEIAFDKITVTGTEDLLMADPPKASHNAELRLRAEVADRPIC
jgi:UDP-N-acetylglucosamine 1-carboxyvinyltransferase